jgi:hypothetical protein
MAAAATTTLRAVPTDADFLDDALTSATFRCFSRGHRPWLVVHDPQLNDSEGTGTKLVSWDASTKMATVRCIGRMYRTTRCASFQIPFSSITERTCKACIAEHYYYGFEGGYDPW